MTSMKASNAQAIMRELLLQFIWLDLVSCLEIVNHSPALIVAKTGESLELFCESKNPYQWCMMKHNRLRLVIYLNLYSMYFDSKQFLTVGEDLEVSRAEEIAGAGLHWWKTRTRCGLVIEKEGSIISELYFVCLSDESQ